MNENDPKRAAAAAALDLVEPGMRLGLGTGSTAWHFVDLLGARVQAGLDVIAMPTSEATRRQSLDLGIPLFDPGKFTSLDLAVDGADEFDPALNLIKGGGAAHTREKIVARAAARFIVIADQKKRVTHLGAFPLPLEILPFGLSATLTKLSEIFRAQGLPDTIAPRKKADGSTVVSDNGNLIFDAMLGEIRKAPALANALDGAAGLIDHGLFIAMAERVFLGVPGGVEEILPE